METGEAHLHECSDACQFTRNVFIFLAGGYIEMSPRNSQTNPSTDDDYVNMNSSAGTHLKTTTTTTTTKTMTTTTTIKTKTMTTTITTTTKIMTTTTTTTTMTKTTTTTRSDYIPFVSIQQVLPRATRVRPSPPLPLNLKRVVTFP